VAGRGLARAGTRNQRLDPHHAHQTPHPFAIDPTALSIEFERHPSRAVERQFQMQFVDPPHQSQIVDVRLRLGPIDPGAGHVQQRALPADR